jgi:hypothetical protein
MSVPTGPRVGARPAGFVLEVTQVHSIEEEIEIRDWKVETLQGPRTFRPGSMTGPGCCRAAAS